MPADAHRNCRLPGNTTCAIFQLGQNRQQTLLSFNRGTSGHPNALHFGSSMNGTTRRQQEEEDTKGLHTQHTPTFFCTCKKDFLRSHAWLLT